MSHTFDSDGIIDNDKAMIKKMGWWWKGDESYNYLSVKGYQKPQTCLQFNTNIF